ncbi:MAG: hypothetical protein FWD16_04430 [Clostridia bacterium]|nr:hypothetical protein [Clostridia bacterium]
MLAKNIAMLMAFLFLTTASSCAVQRDTHIKINSSMIYELDGEQLYKDLLAEMKPVDNMLYALSSISCDINPDGEINDMIINICAKQDNNMFIIKQTRYFKDREITLIKSSGKQVKPDYSIMKDIRPFLLGISQLPWEKMNEYVPDSPMRYLVQCEHSYDQSWENDSFRQFSISGGNVEEIGSNIPFQTSRLMFHVMPLYAQTNGGWGNNGESALLFYVE